jgi:hypothetical protein
MNKDYKHSKNEVAYASKGKETWSFCKQNGFTN